MANLSILEEMLDHLVNENKEQAESLFHDYVVAKSREIYESLLEDGYPEDDEDDQFEEAFGDESDDDFGGDATDELEKDIDDNEDDEFGDDEFGSDEEESTESELYQDLDSIVDELQAKFDELKSLQGHNVATDDADEDEEEGEFGEKDVNDSFEHDLATVREYVEKVSVKHGDDGANTKSIVAGANDMGGTSANLVRGDTSDSGSTKGGLVDPNAKPLTNDNVNTVPGKFKDLKKVAAPKKADDGANTASLFRGKRK